MAIFGVTELQNLMEVGGRIATALERLAAAQERAAAVDPMAILNDALEGAQGESGPSAEGMAEAYKVLGIHPGDVVDPFASNGLTVMYRHPDPQYVFVARRYPDAPGGWSIAVEER